MKSTYKPVIYTASCERHGMYANKYGDQGMSEYSNSFGFLKLNIVITDMEQQT